MNFTPRCQVGRRSLPHAGVGPVGPGWGWSALTFVVPALGAWLVALGFETSERPRAGLKAFAPTLVFCIGVVQFLPSFV